MPYLNRLPPEVERLIDLDRSALAPLPPLRDGDVARLCAIQSTDGRPIALSARSAASAALAAGAHAGPTAMARMTIEKHWRPGGRNEVIVPDSVDRPMPLLPFVRKAVDDYLTVRGKPRFGPLFAMMNGGEVNHVDLALSLGSTLELFGVRGEDIFDALHAYFRRQLHGIDAVAVDYMLGRFTYWKTRQLTRTPDTFPTVNELRKILEDRHRLAGPASDFFGPSPPFLENAPCNLGPRVHRRWLSEAMRSDPVVVAIAAVRWPDGEVDRRLLRKDLTKAHFGHLYELWETKKLTTIEIAWLLRLRGGAGRANQMLRDFIPPGVPTIVRTAAELGPMLIERWRARPDGEKVFDFAWRMVHEIGLHSIASADSHLRRAGEIGGRRRGRPRKLHRRAA
ncbi:hypothetical protein ACVMAJ_003577 [Bradyrhizobium sp. USDA 4448]